jgi:hypothetical protein
LTGGAWRLDLVRRVKNFEDAPRPGQRARHRRADVGQLAQRFVKQDQIGKENKQLAHRQAPASTCLAPSHVVTAVPNPKITATTKP